jgi:hypothetical protein
MRNGCTLAIGSLLVFCGPLLGCAAAGGEPAPVSPNQAQAAPVPASSPVTSAPKLHTAFTRGPMEDPQARQWQSDLLHAIGRDEQYALFDYVFDESGRAEKVYVGVSYEPLGLSPAELDAANAVQARYAATPMGSTSRDGIWLANAWLNGPEGLAKE